MPLEAQAPSPEPHSASPKPARCRRRHSMDILEEPEEPSAPHAYCTPFEFCCLFTVYHFIRLVDTFQPSLRG